MSLVEIEYCVPCGHLDRAIQLQRAILEEFGQNIDGVTLKTGDSGVFTVSVDDEQLFDKAEEAYDETAIIDRINTATVTA